MPKLQCSITKTWWSVTTNHKRELVEQYGSEDALTSEYVCRTARRLRKEGKTDAEILKAVEAGEIVSKTEAPKRLSKTSTPKKSKSAKSTKTNKSTKVEKQPEDQDVADFLASDDEPVVAAGDASDKAV